MIQPTRRSTGRTAWLQGCVALLLGGLLHGLLQLAPTHLTSARPATDPVVQEALPKPARSPVRATALAQIHHLAALGADRWHQQGTLGQKVKIAVLDSGFQGYQDQLGKALPEQVTTRSFRLDGKMELPNSQHGVLCAEVVHAVAPAAELMLINWEPNDPNSFLEALRWTREQGARVISCSLIMPSWSDGEGGGMVNQSVAKIMGAGKEPGDMLFFASAGNTAQRHWCGTFSESVTGYHQWRNGDTINTLTPWGKDRVAVELYGVAAGDFELSVTDAATGQSAGDCQARHLGNKSRKVNCLLVRFTPELNRTYQIMVRSKKPGAPDAKEKLHLVVLGGDLAYTCAHGSISCPADGAGVCAVGAVNQDGQRWGYSSCGPNSPLPKPDYVAMVPFPSSWRAQPFGGTSAAAPQAAGLASLWWAKHPDWSASQVKDAMRQSAVDLGPPGHDYETGYGLLKAP